MNGLILHCGATAIDRGALLAMPEPKALGAQHQPVHHGDYVQYVDRALDAMNFTVKEEAFGITRGGLRFFGMMDIEGPGIVDGGEKYSFTIGLRGSHDASFAREISGGGHVFVCDNLAFTGADMLKTRQTTNVHDRLPGMVFDLVQKVSGWSERIAEQYSAYEKRYLTSSQADALLLGMVRRGIVMPSEMGRLIEAWDAPPHEEFAEPTVWRAFNAATEVLKPRNPDTPRLMTLQPKTLALHKLCDEVVGLDVLH